LLGSIRLLVGSIQRLRSEISDELRMLRKQRFQFGKKRWHFGIVNGRGFLTQLLNALFDRADLHNLRTVVSKSLQEQYRHGCNLGDTTAEGRSRGFAGWRATDSTYCEGPIVDIFCWAFSEAFTAPRWIRISVFCPT